MAKNIKWQTVVCLMSISYATYAYGYGYDIALNGVEKLHKNLEGILLIPHFFHNTFPILSFEPVIIFAVIWILNK